MNEIVKLVAKKTGMSEAVAQIAVTTVISAIKAKLPANIGGLLDTFLATSAATKPAGATKKTAAKSPQGSTPLGDVGNIVGGLASLFKK